MRKIEQEMVDAVRNRRNWKQSNTTVKIEDGTVTVLLHGSPIYKETPQGVQFTLAGWNTLVTRNRLNALLEGVRVFQKAYRPYYTKGGDTYVIFDNKDWITI